MTPAEELRAAAARIREVAGKADPGPWHLDTGWDAVLAADRSTVTEAFATISDQRRDNAIHIALWDPIVAELVVPILELEAKQWDAYDHQNSRPGDARTRVMPHELDNAVLALARAINGGAS